MSKYYSVPTAVVIAILLFISLAFYNSGKKPLFLYSAIGFSALLIWVLGNTPYCTPKLTLITTTTPETTTN